MIDIIRQLVRSLLVTLLIYAKAWVHQEPRSSVALSISQLSLNASDGGGNSEPKHEYYVPMEKAARKIKEVCT